jgi:hypothetical protein
MLKLLSNYRLKAERNIVNGDVMIKDEKLLSRFEREYIRMEKTNYFDSLRFFEEMWNEGVYLGVLPSNDPLDGIEVDLRIARILNHV